MSYSVSHKTTHTLADGVRLWPITVRAFVITCLADLRIVCTVIGCLLTARDVLTHPHCAVLSSRGCAGSLTRLRA